MRLPGMGIDGSPSFLDIRTTRKQPNIGNAVYSKPTHKSLPKCRVTSPSGTKQAVLNRATYKSDEKNWTAEQGVLRKVIRSNVYNDT